MATITPTSPNGSGRTGRGLEQRAVRVHFIADRTHPCSLGPDAQHRPAERAGVASSLEGCWGYAVTSVPCGVWLGRSSSFSPVRRAWAKPRPTSTAMMPARQNAAMAHQRAMAAIRLKP